MPPRALLRRFIAAPAVPHVRARVAWLFGIVGLMLCALPGVAAAAPVIGSAEVQSLVDTNTAGLAKAFRYSAPTSGTVDELNVYVDGSSAASAVHVGLYSSAKERPAGRLTACTLAAPRSGWNACTAAAVNVTAGTKYWLAILAPAGNGGRVAFRDRPRDGAVSYESSNSMLASLPATFPVGAKRNGYSPASIYGATATAPHDSTAPSVPTGLTRTAGSETSVSLSWTASTDAVGVDGYRVYRDGVLAGATAATATAVSGLACGTSYVFAVEAYDATGNTSARASLTAGTAACAVDTQAPSVPQGLGMTSASESSIGLRWDASTDNVGVAGYRLYRNDVAVATTSNASYSYSGLACGTTYKLAIEAFDAAGNASNRGEATTYRSTAACAVDTQAPSVPQGLAISSASESSIGLRWDASTDNVGVAGYRLYRDDVAVATTSNASYSYSGLACGTTYKLAIEAFDAAGNASNRGEATTYPSTAACADTPPPAPPSSDGSASVFVSPSGSDGNSCSQVAPCASFNRAYRVAQPGQVVEVANGSYPAQALLLDASKSADSARVVIRPAAGATVTLANLRFGSSVGSTDGPRSVTVRGMRVADANGKQRLVTAYGNATNVMLENIDAANFYLNGVRDFTVRGGDWGPCLTTSTSTASNEGVDGCSNSKIDGNANNHNITIEDAVFHDYRIIPNSGAHFECMIIFGGTNITIRRNRFINCEFYDIFIQHSSTHKMDGMKIENNWFDTPWNGQNVQNRPGAVAFSPRGRAFNDILIRYNSFLDSGVHVNEDGSGIAYSNFRLIGNIGKGAWSGCYPSATFRSNVWIGSACNSSDRTSAAYPYLNPVKGHAGDYHLAGGAAVDLVTDTSPDAALDTDRDKAPRPRGAGRDAGAHELR